MLGAGTGAPTALHDTSSISNFIRDAEFSTSARLFLSPHVPAISFQTEAELLMWEQAPDIADDDLRRLHEFLASALVLQSNAATNRHFAEILLARRARHPDRPWRDRKIRDAWIAATALGYGLPLITFDRRDFLEIGGLRLIMLG